ncbi:DsbA family oxidoreductase [Desulfoscipio gibsoniae]|uniref:DsbA family oxidoreductase n=1 Tax=Desulfoscipio gibsoniae TaxID=102134 RepID=UPI0009FF9B79|nr:DsbA family protein [Desulfoscipio gibsoniae]
MGKGIVDKLKQEFDIAEEWVGYELHPETPSQGRLIRELFPDVDVNKMLENFRRAGQPYGIEFSGMNLVANSCLALQASELSRDRGKYEQAHARLFKAYFQEEMNIGDKQVLIKLFIELGLNEDELIEALDKQLYLPRLQKNRELARQYEITSVPTFIINEKQKLVGAQPYQVFQQTLRLHQ